jgi:hypothetical protein
MAMNRDTRRPYFSRPRGTNATRRVTMSGRFLRPISAASAIACARASCAWIRSAFQVRRTAHPASGCEVPIAAAIPRPRRSRRSGAGG